MITAPTNNSDADAWDIVALAALKSPLRENYNTIDGASIHESTDAAFVDAFADVDATLEDDVALAIANDTLEESTVAATATAFQMLTTAAANSLPIADGATLLTTRTVAMAEHEASSAKGKEQQEKLLRIKVGKLAVRMHQIHWYKPRMTIHI